MGVENFSLVTMSPPFTSRKPSGVTFQPIGDLPSRCWNASVDLPSNSTTAPAGAGVLG